eukprot:TRINITY_DN2595_c0_g1_i4.p1 TRINITY_DN2595_c0_g1~~TRINITY_DN2595_c0_g1_i4.p1  ORF type:complete len:205 (-),score=26.78 TRINITY_DN2595_c0_g1_i4:391-1005(-)
MASPRTAYLVTYNSILFIAWSTVLAITVQNILLDGPFGTSTFASMKWVLTFAQTAALLEILHSITGLVRAQLMATLPQVGSRIFVLWCILLAFPQVRENPLVNILVLSWSITEVVRYAFFAVRDATGVAPSFLLWLRYSLFFVLYPTGVFGEIGLTVAALPWIKDTHKYDILLPNPWNFAFDSYVATLVILVVYIPGNPLCTER